MKKELHRKKRSKDAVFCKKCKQLLYPLPASCPRPFLVSELAYKLCINCIGKLKDDGETFNSGEQHI